jgi:nitrite reductase (NADH) small subunit
MNPDTTWVRITACENIPVREGRVTVVRGRQIAIFNLGDRFLAIDNRCPHRGGPLAEGIISGTTVVCPLHAWKIDLQTGVVASPSSHLPCLATFPARVADGFVEIEIPLTDTEQEPSPDKNTHRDRPIRWVQRKPDGPISAASELL